MSKARELANLGNAYSDGALSNRNLIINGAMQVAQRGTSFSGLTNGGNGFTLDRWEWKESGSPTAVMTVTQASDAPNEMGNGNSLKIEVTTAQASIASGERVRFEQNIEAQNLQSVAKGTSAAKPVTASFWVKSNKTGTYILEIVEDDNARIISKAYTVDAANTWEYKTITFPADTTGVINNDNGKGFTFRYYLTAGSQWAGGSLNTDWVNYTGNENGSAVGQVNFTETIGNTWQITGVQLEVGDTATPFEHEPYSATYNKCLRYYYNTPVLRGGSNNPVVYTGNYVELQGTRHRFADVLGYRSQTVFHPVVMRATPTMTLYNPNNGGASGQWQLYNYDSATQNFGGFVGGGRATMFYLAGYTGVTVGGAGLSLISNCHWEADAEL